MPEVNFLGQGTMGEASQSITIAISIGHNIMIFKSKCWRISSRPP